MQTKVWNFSNDYTSFANIYNLRMSSHIPNRILLHCILLNIGSCGNVLYLSKNIYLNHRFKTRGYFFISQESANLLQIKIFKSYGEREPVANYLTRFRQIRIFGNCHRESYTFVCQKFPFVLFLPRTTDCGGTHSL